MVDRLCLVGALLWGALFGAGCASISIRVDRSTYAPGDSGYAEIKNEGWRTTYGNFCTDHTVERHSGAAWIPVERHDRTCTKELDGYAPGSVRAAAFHIPRDTSDGTYRLAARFEGGGAGDKVASNEFVVVGAD